MKTIKYVIILLLLTKMFVVHVIASFEPFVYEENPTEVGDNFQNAFQAIDSSDSFDTQQEGEDVAGFIGHNKDSDPVKKLDTGFKAEKMDNIKIASSDFESTGPEVEDRVLTDIQKSSQKILEERLKEDSKKQQMLSALQEQEYLKMQQKIWKAFESKADKFGQKKDVDPEKKQRATQAQSLLQQLQASKNSLLEKDKLANDLATQLAKINAQRITTAQRLKVQKATRRSLSGAVNSKTKEGSAQFNQARNQEQISSEQFIRLDKQFNIVNSKLQDVRNQAQDMREQFQKIQQALEQQLPASLYEEEGYY